jgi:hypothetical protein
VFLLAEDIEDVPCDCLHSLAPMQLMGASISHFLMLITSRQAVQRRRRGATAIRCMGATVSHALQNRFPAVDDYFVTP